MNGFVLTLMRVAKLTDSFNDVGQDNSVGDIVRQILYASLGFDLFQVMIGPVGVDLSSPRETKQKKKKNALVVYAYFLLDIIIMMQLFP